MFPISPSFVLVCVKIETIAKPTSIRETTTLTVEHRKLSVCVVIEYFWLAVFVYKLRIIFEQKSARIVGTFNSL